ncbi:glycosyltransferase [Pseudoroseomonas wenyumeiae]
MRPGPGCPCTSPARRRAGAGAAHAGFLAALDYPALEVLVVDTHTAEPALWEAAAEHCARLGPQFRFFHLGCTPGGRAGALNFALQEAAPDTVLVGVLRAGQVVRASWLRRMVPLFRRPGLGMAQGMLAPLDARDPRLPPGPPAAAGRPAAVPGRGAAPCRRLGPHQPLPRGSPGPDPDAPWLGQCLRA